MRTYAEYSTSQSVNLTEISFNFARSTLHSAPSALRTDSPRDKTESQRMRNDSYLSDTPCCERCRHIQHVAHEFSACAADGVGERASGASGTLNLVADVDLTIERTHSLHGVHAVASTYTREIVVRRTRANLNGKVLLSPFDVLCRAPPAPRAPELDARQVSLVNRR